MSRKLLSKTLNYYIAFSIFALTIACVVFYFFLKNLYLEEANENLESKQNWFIEKHLKQFKISEIKTWNKYNESQKILTLTVKNRNPKSQEVFLYDPLQGEILPFRILTKKIKIENSEFLLQTRISMLESDDLIESIILLFAFMLFLLFIGFILLTKFMSQKLWKPFYLIIQQIKNFEIDKKQDALEVKTKIEEFTFLADAIDNLMVRNVEIFQNQREFIENAAHELQTPLAIVQNQVSLLIQNQNITEEQAVIIQKIADSITRLNRLNKNLLLLAKLENSSFEIEDIDFSQFLKDYLELFAEQIDISKLHIESKITDSIILRSNIQLIESLLSNLLSNAIKHNFVSGRVIIEATEDYLKISNTSTNKALSVKNMYTRFQKSNSNVEGNGLGLSILKKIVEKNNWEIDYYFDNELHFFEIRFKIQN